MTVTVLCGTSFDTTRDLSHRDAYRIADGLMQAALDDGYTPAGLDCFTDGGRRMTFRRDNAPSYVVLIGRERK